MFFHHKFAQKLCVTMVKHPGGSNCLKFLRVGCWNVKSLVEMDGGIKIATLRPKCRPVSVDKKVKFLVQELRCFHMGIVCISETKWFGDDVYEVDGFMVLHSVVMFLSLVMSFSMVRELLLCWIP